MVVMVTIEDNHKLDHAWLSWLPLKMIYTLDEVSPEYEESGQ